MRSSLVKSALQELRQRIGKEISGIRVKELVIGIAYTGVRLSSDDIGLAYSPLADFSHGGCGSNLFSSAGTLTDLPAIELAEASTIFGPEQVVVGVAALNALSQLAIKTKGDDIIKKYGDAVDLSKIRKGDTVVVVGNMRPSVQMLRRKAKEVLVLERAADRETGIPFPTQRQKRLFPEEM